MLDLIKDGDTIQMGIRIPEAVVSGLEGKDLGVLTGMFPIGLPQLVEQGIVTNRRKPFHQSITAATFCMGDEEIYRYVGKTRPAILSASYTNDPFFIARHPNMG